VAKDNNTLAVFTLFMIFAALGYMVYYSVKNNKRTLNLIALSFIFILIGFTTFAMVIIRSNQNPPMNENEPNTFTELVSYLNREQYGDFPTFKRRFTAESHQTGVYTNYSSDFDFFWNYQMHHMMTRYFLWNYAGRENWVQDSGANIAPFNGIGNIFGKIINVRFAGDVKDSLFAIPLLLGIFGIYYHFRRDWKMAAVFMVMFILLGYLTAFYQNQQQPQPRERDYFYVGAFFVFSIWIALGLYGLAQLLYTKFRESSFRNAAVVTVLVLGFVLVPVKMITANYFTHDRSNNWVPWDYAYNLLQSCAPNAVLFTNGDNDTFPLWYLQDVEGVRRDVKVANLSLLNTSWYIKQLKNNDPYNVGTVNIRFSDAQIDNIRPVQWEPVDVTIKVPPPGEGNLPKDVVRSFNIQDSSILNQGQITFRMNNTLTVGNIKAVRVQDLIVKEIIEANNWERPIYFAVTVSEDSKIGTQDYLKMEGMGQRLVPERRRSNEEFLNPVIMREQLFNEPEGYSKDYQAGFKFRSMDNPDVFLDENHTRMTQNYRNAYLRLAMYYSVKNQNEYALETLDKMEETMPRDVVNMDFYIKYQLSDIYNRVGGKEQYNELASELEPEAWKRIEENPADAGSYWSPYRVLLDIYEHQQNYSKSYEVWEKLSQLYPGDPTVKSNMEKYKLLTSNQDSTR
jgi:tetratricopeptide (TPR) repeat protein